MLGINDLKEKIGVSETKVECPVRHCTKKVYRQTKKFRRLTKYKCPIHRIFISPTTFEYDGEEENLIWKDKDDLDLLERIKQVKRESRMTRDNSEDAVTWNVFRFLERSGLIKSVLNELTGLSSNSPEVMYWSYSQKEKGRWSNLMDARIEFGEDVEKGSEPDIIIKTDSSLFFIEAKLTAGNKTSPSNLQNTKQYTTGGNNWFSKIFRSDYETIAIREKKYELMRFWLIGTWMADQYGLHFELINLVCSQQETGIENIFKKHIIETERRKFQRLEWENICQHIEGIDPLTDKDKMMKYFQNKSLGYNKEKVIRKAFL